MERYTILLRSAQEAAEFVDRVSDYQETVELVIGGNRMDAKSFLGVVGIGLGKTVIVEIQKENSGLFEKLTDFVI